MIPLKPSVNFFIIHVSHIEALNKSCLGVFSSLPSILGPSLTVESNRSIDTVAQNMLALFSTGA